jgi:catalase
MPLPSDQKLVTLSEDIIAQFDTIFGLHPGFRPVHAHGIILTGSFTASADAATLSNAPHFMQPSMLITIRFSSSTGIPLVPNNDPNANPRGFAVRFHLGKHVHTDIIGHSTLSFPTCTGAEFLEFFRALASSGPSTASPTPIEAFLGSHPAALAFVQTPKPPPTSFAREGYFSLHAIKFINGKGAICFGHYSIVPDAGIEHLDENAVKPITPSFLFDELPQCIAHRPISFQLHVQLANEGDTVDDVTVHWPEDRTVINLGKLTLNAVVADNDREQKHIIFDPIPRIQGIEPSDDPLLELRAATYLISGRRRRAAPGT